MKERVTLTLEADLLKKVDGKVDNHRIKNRSHAIELLLMKALQEKPLKKALILAGGKGTRLKPITDEIPKPMILLHGKPILQHTLDLLRKYGVDDVYISVGYKGDVIKEYFGNGSRFGIKITYIEEKEPLGTAGPLALARPYLTETFVMCNADELKDIDLADMYLFHKERGALATIALTTVEDPSSYGVAMMQGDKVMQFLEKPEKPLSKLINAGLYILEPEVVSFVKTGFSLIEKDVFPKIAAEKRLYGYSFSGQWFDTGNLERYAKARQDWKGLNA
ncbi:NTP transferase domain-containing protein [Candidatus Woesearchaeota archaeon]|nr:NTP transferase domain-containing protein [Candidatus Woesearchaeota archaeon]